MKYYLILPMTLGLMFSACNQQVGDEDTVATPTVVEDTQVSNPMVSTGTLEAAPVSPVKTVSRPAPRQQAKPAATKPKATAPAKEKAQKETLYVETYGAQGKVWGHVTMDGDRGTGTIHDADENTLSVTVTRHGDELFAVDQNSRQYVFKLKQNKTQE